MAESGPDTTLTFAERSPAPSGRSFSSWAIPPDILNEAVRRLRAVACIYALAYALAGPLPQLLSSEGRTMLASHPLFWMPAAFSIGAALAFALAAGSARLAPRAKVRLGLAFEVLASFGIAAAEYHHVTAPVTYGTMGTGGFGLSWVGTWVMLFSAVVPVPPRVALTSAVLSVAAVPLVYAAGMSSGINLRLTPEQFFFALVFPYMIVVMIAGLAARVVYRLGTAVREAREMGSYRLVERLGRGGMGEVWRAQHRHLVRPAAIKLIRPEVLGAQDAGSREVLLRRFEREAQATSLLRSAHTLALYDFGVTEEGTLYHVMELLDGFDLSALVRRFGPVPPERAVHLLLQVCDSLGEAHASGLIHRDVKPANIYACRYGREVDFVKVLDFGLVKQRGPSEPEGDQLTAEEIAGGTPAFMAPEQALGEREVDGRSDLYALGCVAYWLLTGTTVFQGRTVMETIVMHVHTLPDPPSRRIGRPIPAALEAAVMRCLAKDPGARPQTAEELAALLRGVPLEEPWSPARARAWWAEQRPEPAEARTPVLTASSPR